MSPSSRQPPVRLRTDGLGVRFGAVTALEDVTVDVGAATRVVVTGQAASGKTTWLKCLAGLQRPTTGTVRWDDVVVAALDATGRRSRQAAFGMVFQSDALFDSMTVLDNVLLPLVKRQVPKAEAEESAREALARVGLEAAASRRPESLSGGMKKRVGVARAIVSRPSVLLADDPFAGLDPATERSIGELLLEVSHGCTLIAALPDPTPALPLPRVLRFEAGRLVHDGGLG
ncbi:MAG: ATP-binding cassette domain-containing protein [Myxococcaceae bacterium]|nr:ATP-binding cassette domain-containing protein [Myxococcaceae bacterium]